MSGARGSSGARALEQAGAEASAHSSAREFRAGVALVPEVAAGRNSIPVSSSAERRENLVIPAIAGFGMLALAIGLLPTTPGQGDGAEFTLALALGGLPHPTGYPLYVLLGHPFVKLLHAMGASFVVAANAWSAVGASLALALFARLGLELIRATAGDDARSRARALPFAALIPAALLALNPVWLIAATQAEVYSFWYAGIAAVALVSLIEVRRMHATRVDRSPGKPADARDLRMAIAWGVLCGASLVHHLASVMLLAPLSLLLSWTAWRTGRRLRPLLIACIAATALPLAALAHVAWRAFHPAVYQWPVEADWLGIGQHVTGSVYSRFVGGGFTPYGLQLELIASGVMPFLMLLPLVGLWALRVRSAPVRWWLLTLLVAVGTLTALVFRYGVPDPAAYFGPAMMAGFLVMIPLFVTATRRGRSAVAMVVAIALAVTAASWAIPWATAERARLSRVDQRMRAAWNAVPFERGFVVFKDDHSARLEILRLLESQRPGLHVINPHMLTWAMNRDRFFQEFGFDPVALVRKDYVTELPMIIGRGTALPVVDFRDILEDRLPHR